MNLFIKEIYIDKTLNCINGDSAVYETGFTDTKALFEALQKEHGRCVSGMYKDTEQGAVKIGWCFEKKKEYVDTGETYVQETWIELHEKAPLNDTEYFYKVIT